MAILKARDIERLENTSLASTLAGGAGLGATDTCGGPCTSFTTVICQQDTNICDQCTACSVGTVCTVSGSCCTGVTACDGLTGIGVCTGSTVAP
jgi:hypothetical protein